MSTMDQLGQTTNGSLTFSVRANFCCRSFCCFPVVFFPHFWRCGLCLVRSLTSKLIYKLQLISREPICLTVFPRAGVRHDLSVFVASRFAGATDWARTGQIWLESKDWCMYMQFLQHRRRFTWNNRRASVTYPPLPVISFVFVLISETSSFDVCD